MERLTEKAGRTKYGLSLSYRILTGPNFDESIVLNKDGIQGEVAMDNPKLVKVAQG